MKSVAPAWYNYVITGLDSIVEDRVHVEPYRDGLAGQHVTISLMTAKEEPACKLAS